MFERSEPQRRHEEGKMKLTEEVRMSKASMTYSYTGYYNLRLEEGQAIVSCLMWLSLLVCWSSQKEFQRESEYGCCRFSLDQLLKGEA